MKVKHILILAFILIVAGKSFSQQQIVYKQIDSIKLVMELHRPESMDFNKEYPAMVFFFGGGWNKGTIKQFEPHAKYFSKRGMVCFLVDYRVRERHHTTPIESLKDAKSAIRYIKEHASEFQIDTSKIVASGASAGGQLAAATALISDYNETSDDVSINCKPNALVLFNPAIDNGPAGVGYNKIGDAYKNFSPLHNIEKGAPPTILFLGTNDYLIPVETVKYYQTVMQKVGSTCELHLYEGKKHGFFNYNKFENYRDTIIHTDNFLVSLGYLDPESKVKIE
ncbi:alpha/beta hydrolase [Aestuariivivens sediminis]|uniref:alpha/beta hydrolase n=1 Tax=Aestuariivivens sediminis TaxID=2913557 RepID=UPI001F591679|nr:alpha/beta hydrolase [Aestuariivivens sediminis]